MTKNRVAILAIGILAAAGAAAAWITLAWREKPAKELADADRVEPAKKALKLDEKMFQLYHDGNCPAALELARESLCIRRALHPSIHPEVAASLNNLGFLLKSQGDYGKAEAAYREALEMCKKLYPADKYPNGHPDLALSLLNMGGLLEDMGNYSKAEADCREATEMYQRLYPADKFPAGRPELAASLGNLGTLLHHMGEYGKAEVYSRGALEMKRKLYPADKFPAGRPELAASLDNLGCLLLARGEYGGAEPFFREALAMYKKLYPADKYPSGHPDLAVSLNNMASLLLARHEYGRAEPYYRDALAMYKKLYPADKYPSGHPDVLAILSNLASVLAKRGEYDLAEPYHREALEMCKKLYPADKYPNGHPSFALNLIHLAGLLNDKGEHDRAEPFCRDAVEMYRRLYRADKFPDGHPELAGGLNIMGHLLTCQGEYGKATDAFAEASAMYDRLTTVFARASTEAEALNLIASLPPTRRAFLAAASHAEAAHPVEQYAVLWQGKSALARALQQRRRLLQTAAHSDEATRRKFQALTEARQDLARLILAPAHAGDADRKALLQELTDSKERLEKELAGVLHASERVTPPYTQLGRVLPDGAAFLDFYRYQDYDAKTRKWADARYALFVLRRDRPIRRIELTDGDAIDKDLQEWRNDVINNLRSDAADRLRKNVWQPVAAALGNGLDTIYVCPDGPLSALPWPALPGAEPGRTLLEDYAFALVPSGPFLLEQLTQPAHAKRAPGVLLAVGGVRYDRDDKVGKPWPSLPATEKERAVVVAEAGKLSHPPEIVERSGAGADVPRLLADLPKARWAHLATHGFFAAPDSKEREHLFRPDDFLMGVGSERHGAAAHNPLTLSGLVLAGANQPTDADSGVLSGEAVAGLDLDGMDLAVLSACQTGLGEAAAGEGVFGLQRAFHIGGARNVVASLWKVNDEATAALMNRFYYHLWEKNEPPLQALRHAQLELYRHPGDLSALAKRGAISFDDTEPEGKKPAATAKAAPAETAAPQLWAAFVISGAGK